MSKRKAATVEMDDDGAENMIQPFKKKTVVDQSERKKQQNKALQAISEFLSVSEKYSKAWANQREQLRANDEFDEDIEHFQGTLRDYQKVGVKWMETLYLNRINGILADEMGLGKTVQVIAFLCNLNSRGVNGIHLICVPLSTMPNWISEMKRFAPDLPLIKYVGDKAERQAAYKSMVAAAKNRTGLSSIVLAPRHLIAANIKHFMKVTYDHFIIDEGHLIKNYKSQISKAVREIKCESKLLLTGTPLQNNMQELWTLLNFIMPNIFKKMEIFNQLIQAQDLVYETGQTTDLHDNSTVLDTVKRVLEPFMLRRLKVDVLDENVPIKNVTVYCKMTEQQIDMYMCALKSDLASMRGLNVTDKSEKLDKAGRKFRASRVHQVLQKQKNSPKTEKTKENLAHAGSLLNPILLYRRIVDHPHLVSAPLIPGTKKFLVDETLVTSSGKMRMLDALLPRLIERGHKIIVFSTLVIMLDLIEDYLEMRGIDYEILTGSDKVEDREESIRRFNADPDLRVFLLSTRAGGLGINLTTADTVIFYDNDWNPHADLQAQARCHRIGQTRPVVVYSLIAANSIDEYIKRIGDEKLCLEKAVMLKSTDRSGRIQAVQELVDFYNQQKNSAVYRNGLGRSKKEINKLLDRSDLEAEVKAKAKLLVSGDSTTVTAEM